MNALTASSRFDFSTVTVLVLAAGKGERFRASGGTCHKLEALIAAKPMLWHVMKAVDESGLRALLVRPHGGTGGMGESIALGVRSTPDAAGWLILPADLPLIQAGTLHLVANSLSQNLIVAPHCDGRRGHPVAFRRELYHDLAALSADYGASSIVRANQSLGHVLDLAVDDIGIAEDVDTITDLVRVEKILRLREHAEQTQ